MANLTREDQRKLRGALLELLQTYDADPPEAIRKLTDTCRDILADLALADIATDVARGKWQEHFDKKSYAEQFQEFYYRYVNAKTP